MLLHKRWTLVASAVAVFSAVAVPSGVYAYRTYRDQTVRSQAADYQLVGNGDGDPIWALRAEKFLAQEEEEEDDLAPRHDDPRGRMMAMRGMLGVPTPEARLEFMRIAREEAERWADLLPKPPSSSDSSAKLIGGDPNLGPIGTGANGQAWANLGPTDAAYEWNGTQYNEVDSGRAAGIIVDPRDANVVLLATSGGGIWKTYNASAATPTWFPITEALGNIAIGQFDLDPQAPDTLHVGLGDAFDVAGGQMVKTTNGGASWSAAVLLAGTYPAAAGSLAVTAETIRGVKIDPTNSSIIYTTTNVGLFRSTDGGATYQLVDLPNSGATQVAEATWSIAYAGGTGATARWVVSGVYACRQGVKPPDAGWGVVAGAADPLNGGTCTVGNLGDIWYTANGGGTWSSVRAGGGLGTTDAGRITIGAGAPKANPATTVLYAQNEKTDETVGNGLWRSTNGGQTWAVASGSLSNRTNASFGTRDCGDINVNNQQSWYNAAVAVDPGNDNNVLVGGMLCGLRTTSGLSATPVWDNISHWLPSGGGGDTTQGTLPYVHADWHRALVSRVGGTLVAYAGSDGGLFHSTNLFTAANGASVIWDFRNRGIVTHLAYSIGSGDPATGAPAAVITGLQDNGTRLRDVATSPTTFNQPNGGDGFYSAIARSSTGASVYWSSVYSGGGGQPIRCVPGAGNNNCNQGGAFSTVSPPLATCAGDARPFVGRVLWARGSSAANTMLTMTAYGVHKAVGTGAWALIGSCFNAAGSVRQMRYLGASDTTDGLLGVALSGGTFAVTTNCTGTSTACTWSTSTTTGFDFNGTAGIQTDEQILGTSSIAFPPNTALAPAGQVYVVGSQSPTTVAGGVVPAALGHIFKTTNGGATWTPLHGNGTSDLPNVPVEVIRFDPSDTSNNTLYVGLDLGLYRTTDGGLTWQRFGAGLPLVKVNDMFVGINGGILRIGTFGRGLWEIYPSATAEHGVNGNGDFDRNLQIDVVDLAASASRLGTNPATTAQPVYDWNMDVTAAPTATNAIEESDLSAVLGKFGSRP